MIHLLLCLPIAHLRLEFGILRLPSLSREDALTWFYNLDRLIQHVNEDGRIKVFYSTPSRYVEAKQKETMVKWPLKATALVARASSPASSATGDPSHRS